MININEGMPPEPEQPTPVEGETATEFIYVSIGLIRTAPRIRRDIDP